MLGKLIILVVICLIAGAAALHLYQSKNVRKPGVGKSETDENGTEVKDNPKEKTERR